MDEIAADLLPVPAYSALPERTSAAAAALRPTGEQVWTTADYHLTEATRQALADSVPEETRRAYERWWGQVADWARAGGRVPLPMHPNTLTEWVRELTERISARTGRRLGGSSLDQAVAAVRAVHSIAGYDGQPGTKDARRLIKAHKRMLADVEGRETKQSAIVTPAQVADCVRLIETDMRAAMDAARAAGTDPVRAALPHLRDRFIVTGSFAAWTRRSELARLNIADTLTTDTGGEWRIRSSKTDQAGKGRRIPLARRDDALDPVTARDEYVQALADCGITTGRLLRRIDQWGNIYDSLSAESVNDITQAITARAGCAIDTYGRKMTAHGWRASGNSAAKRAGASAESRRRRGGWSPTSQLPDTTYDRDQDPAADPMAKVTLPTTGDGATPPERSEMEGSEGL